MVPNVNCATDRPTTSRVNIEFTSRSPPNPAAAQPTPRVEVQ